MMTIGFDVGEYEGTRTTPDDRDNEIGRLHDHLLDNALVGEWDHLSGVNDEDEVKRELKWYRQQLDQRRRSNG